MPPKTNPVPAVPPPPVDQPPLPEPEYVPVGTDPTAPVASGESSPFESYTPEEIENAKQQLAAMTPEDLLALDSLVKGLESQTKIPEAGCVIFTEMVSPSGAVYHPTVRAADMITCLDLLASGIKYAKDAYGIVVVKRPAMVNVPVSNPAAPKPPVTGVQARANPPVAPGSTPPAPVAGQAAPAATEPFHIVKISVTPCPNNCADIELFEQGHQYPDLKINKWAVDKIIKLLAPTGVWTPAHFALKTEYPVQWIAYWTHSEKLNQKGNPYKNITKIELAGS